MKGRESGTSCLLGAFGVEGEGGAGFKGGYEGTVLVIDHHAEKFPSKSEDEIARGGGIFALESVEESGVHFQVTGEIWGESETAFAISVSKGGDEEAFWKPKRVGGNAIGGGRKGVRLGIRNKRDE